MREWRIELSLLKPLSLNSRQHWRVKAIAVKEVRTSAHVLARMAKIPTLARFTVELHYAPRFRRNLDLDNLVATLKPFVDGLVDAGVCESDDYRHYVLTSPVVEEPTGASEGRLWAIVRELPEENDDAA